LAEHIPTTIDPYQELLKIVTENALKQVSQMVIKELLKKLSDDDIKKKIKDYLKHKKIEEDQIVASLKESPGLYTVFQDKNVYSKYVRLDEGNGLVILESSAEELITRYGRDDSFYEFNLMKYALTTLFGNSNLGITQVIENAFQKKPKMDATKWSNYLGKEGEKYKAEIHKVIDQLNEICECKVKIIEFQNRVQQTIKDCSIFVKNTAELCSQIIQETGLEGFENKNTFESTSHLSNAMVIYSIYLNAADQVVRLSIKMNVSLDPPSVYIGKFLSNILLSHRS
jgi:hypothetical protein